MYKVTVKKSVAGHVWSCHRQQKKPTHRNGDAAPNGVDAHDLHTLPSDLITFQARMGGVNYGQLFLNHIDVF